MKYAKQIKFNTFARKVSSIFRVASVCQIYLHTENKNIALYVKKFS